MRAYEMPSKDALVVLRSILDSNMCDTDKRYICKSFLLNWTDSERVAELVEEANR